MARARLQKLLARAGIASRRGAEQLIRDGRVRVDGVVVTELGTVADVRRARIEVDGRRVVPEPFVYLVLNKPRSVMCTLRDPEGRPCVADYVKRVGVRVVPVGRLDFNTNGVLLLTNDGDFASALQHPRRQVPKVYVARVTGKVDDAQLGRWQESIVIDGRATQPAQVRRLRSEAGKTWLEVTLVEGRNRQVRRIGEHAGFSEMRLSRTSYAGITCEGLRPGCLRPLTGAELRDLKRRYGVPLKVPTAMPVTEGSSRPRRRVGSRGGNRRQ